MAIQPGDWPLDPYVVDGVTLATRLNNAIPSEFDALKSGKANLAGGNTFSGFQTFNSGTVFWVDMNNGTLSSRFRFSPIASNGIGELNVSSNGSGDGGIYTAWARSDMNNSEFASLRCYTSGTQIQVGTNGSLSGGNRNFTIEQNGRVAFQIEPGGVSKILNTSGGYSGILYLFSPTGDRGRYLRVERATNNIELVNNANNAVPQLFGDNGDIQLNGWLYVKSLTNSSLGGDAIVYHESGTPSGGGSNVRFTWIVETGSGVKVGVGWVTNVGNTLAPASDNGVNLGWGLSRWSVVYAANGTIQTSDAREKTPLRSYTGPEIEAAKELAEFIGFFKWLKDVDEKGEDEALWQAGVTAQKVDEVFKAHGLNALDYGLVSFEVYPEVPAEYKTNEETGEEELVNPGRPYIDRWSANYAQINQFLIRGMHERQKDIEARLAALEAK